MPPTGLQRSNELAIDLDQLRPYAPGAVITGRLTRKQPLVSPEARLTICLRGRSKSLIHVKRQNNHRTYRGRFNFFEPRDVSCKLHSGPIHIPPGGEIPLWPFALTIPATPNPSAIGPQRDARESYLPMGRDDVLSQPLPDAFAYEGRNFWSSTKFHGYVEYYLEAEMVMTLNGKQTTVIATLPIQIQSPHKESLQGGLSQLRKVSSRQIVRSWRLITDPKEDRLSFKQKFRSMYGSSVVPSLAFTIQAYYPVKLQLGNVIPFGVRVIPNLKDSSEACQNISPMSYTLASLSLQLKSDTSVLCAGALYPHDQTSTESYSLPLDGSIRKLGHPVILPVGADVEPLDLGALLHVILEESGVRTLGTKWRQFEQKASPSFKTYNVQRTYMLEWEMDLLVANVENVVHYSGRAAVELVAPSDEAPVPYEEQLNEGLMVNKEIMEPTESSEKPTYEEAVAAGAGGADSDLPFLQEKIRA